jgi:hypothetical protein
MPPLPLYVLPCGGMDQGFCVLQWRKVHAEGVSTEDNTYPVVWIGGKVPDYFSLVVENGFGLDLEATHGGGQEVAWLFGIGCSRERCVQMSSIPLLMSVTGDDDVRCAYDSEVLRNTVLAQMWCEQPTI